jgi:hypothetical protein
MIQSQSQKEVRIMPTNKNADLKLTYYNLLMLEYENRGNKVIGLDKALLQQRSIMDAEDVAYVDIVGQF